LKYNVHASIDTGRKGNVALVQVVNTLKSPCYLTGYG